jgi:hypothetical protein
MRLFPIMNEKSGVKSPDSKMNKVKETSLFHTIEYEFDTIVSKIRNIDNIDDNHIKDIIKRQHSLILNYDLFLMDSETRKEAQTLFSNKRFLTNLLDIIGLLDISYHEKICLNKLAYDYYQNDIKDPEVSNLLFQLTKEVNMRDVVVLSGILGISGAKTLAMIRNSSFKEEKCIHRVNTYIIKCGMNLSTQAIINIYCFLFDRFSTLFNYTMLESAPSELSLTPPELNNYNSISLAIISILDSMTSNDMLIVVRNYAYMITNVSINVVPRFRLDTIQNQRIKEVVTQVKVEENLSTL